MARVDDRLLVPALALVGAILAWLLNPYGAANYDTVYSLVWGADIAHGRLPDYAVPVSPTPHPLATLLGIALAPLGAGAEGAAVLAAYLGLGLLVALVIALGRAWFGVAAGVLAGLIVLTRVPFLSFGVRAYLDIPYCALVLAAALTETRRPRAGLPVLVWLGLAGLLRPEAWLFAGGYVAWLAWSGERERLPVLIAAAAAAPALWLLGDLLVAGDPLHSLLDTRAGAAELERRTGLDDVPLTLPRRLGEILREPVLLGAALGGVLSLWLLPSRARLGAVLGIVALLAFCLLAAAGLPILGRYLLAPAAILAIFCGAGAFGWRRLAREHPWFRRWRALGVVVLVGLVALAPAQARRIEDLRGALRIQREIRDDLRALTDRIPSGCAPVAVPNHRPVPLLALWLDRRPREIVSAQLERPTGGAYLDPANDRVERNYTLDPNDPRRLTAAVPGGFERLAANRSWVLYARC